MKHGQIHKTPPKQVVTLLFDRKIAKNNVYSLTVLNRNNCKMFSEALIDFQGFFLLQVVLSCTFSELRETYSSPAIQIRVKFYLLFQI
jgi:hypothetical protein